MTFRRSLSVVMVVVTAVVLCVAVTGGLSNRREFGAAPVVKAPAIASAVPLVSTEAQDPVMFVEAREIETAAYLRGIAEAEAARAAEAAAAEAQRVADEEAAARARVPVARAAPAPASSSVSSWGSSLEPCGGDLPPCYVKMRESGGSYSARNPSGACGAWQIMPGTWNFFAGFSSACDAPPAVQDEKARLLWAGGAGCGHWSAC